MAPEGEPHAHLSSEAADYLCEALRGQAKIREGKPITLPDDPEPESANHLFSFEPTLSPDPSRGALSHI